MAWQWQRRRTWSHALLKEVGITVRSGIFLIDQVERATQMVDRLRVFLSLCKRLRHAPMTGDVQKQARDALAERLARMVPDTVRAKLKDAHAEARRAAALACAI